MHIVILYQYYLRSGEPGHSRLNEYARTWAGMGHEVSVITGQMSYMTGCKDLAYRGKTCVREWDGRVAVYRCFVPDNYNGSFLRRTFAYFSFAIFGALALRRLKAPSVLLVSSPPLTVGIPALLSRMFRRIPVIFEVRDLWPESAVTTGVVTHRGIIGLLSTLESACYRRAARLTVLSPAFKENIVGRGLKTADRIDVIATGVDVEEMHPGKRSESLRRELGWEGKTVVLYTGAIGRANRLSQLVETAKLLRDRPEILIAVVGGGMEEGVIRDQIESAGLANIVLHGARPKADMPPIVASADICAAVLMRNDTFRTVYPNKVFDYMACARPVLLGIDGVIRELVEAKEAGVFVEPENPRAIADGILSLASDPARASAMGCNGRCFVEAEFTRKRMATRYEELLNEVVRTASTP